MVDVPVPSGSADGVVEATSGRFLALRLPAYRVLWSSAVIMWFAVTAQQVARAWLAIELTGTNAGIGGVFLAFGLPLLVLSPIGGVLADRFPKRTMLVLCDATILTSAFVIALAVEFDFLEYWLLFASALVHGIGMALMTPSLMASVGEIVDRPMLPNAVTLLQLGANSPRVVGPAVAGALIGIEAIGAGGVYLLTSTLCLIATIVAAFLPRIAPSDRASRKSPTGELVEGFRYIRSHRPLTVLLFTTTVVTMIGLPFMAFLPSFAKNVFEVGSSGYGIMGTVTAIGALSALFWIAGLVTHANLWDLQARFGFGYGVGLVLLALSPAYLVALAVLACLGGLQAGFQGTSNSLMLTETELEYHGRVSSLTTTGWAAASIMALPLGVIADTVGLRETVTGMGVICIAAIVCYMLARDRVTVAEETASL